MTDHQGRGAPAPGWYADPTGLAGVRWWDGVQWSTYTAPLPASGAAAGAGARPRLPEGAPVYTPFIWIDVLLPLVSAAALFLYHPVLPGIGADGRVVQPTLADTFTPGYVALIVIGLLTTVATIVLAFLDHRRLLQLGVVRPFHWAWSFLVFISPGMLVYPIGRSVIVRQVARPRGLAPVWVLIGTTAASFIVGIAWAAVLYGQVVSQLASLRGGA